MRARVLYYLQADQAHVVRLEDGRDLRVYLGFTTEPLVGREVEFDYLVEYLYAAHGVRLIPMEENEDETKHEQSSRNHQAGCDSQAGPNRDRERERADHGVEHQASEAGD